MRTRRSKWKFNYSSRHLFQAYFLKKRNTLFKTDSRASSILPLFLNLSIGLHDGYTFHKINLDPSMVGHKLGEFVKTRQIFRYGKK